MDTKYCKDDYCIKAVIEKEENIPQTSENDENEDKESETQAPPFTDGLRDYEAPYSQYGMHVGRVLSRRPKTQPTTPQQYVKVANWYFELGKAYRQDAMHGGGSASVDFEKLAVDDVIPVFEHAIKYYKLAFDQSNDNENGISLDSKLSLGSAQALLGESLLLHPTSPKPQEALQHFMDAQSTYQAVLDGNKLSPLQHAEWQLNMADASTHAASLLLQNSEGLDTGDVSLYLQSAQEAESMLEKAIAIYRKTIETPIMYQTKQDQVFYQLQLANSLHNLGTAKMLTSTVGRAIAIMKEARQAFESAIPLVTSPQDFQDSIMGMAELLISLSDAHLQAGHYVEAKSTYRKAMEWYAQHKLTPPEVALIETDDLLSEMEQQLADYHASLSGSGSADIYLAETPGEVMYEPDERYEADLLSAIGSIELSHGQVELAMTYFAKAISLYENVGGEERAIADVMLNMAMALFRQGKFHESAETHGEALDTYRQVLGDGTNPLVFDDMLGLNPNPGGDSDEPHDAENENAFRAQLVNMEAIQQNLVNLTQKDEL